MVENEVQEIPKWLIKEEHIALGEECNLSGELEKATLETTKGRGLLQTCAEDVDMQCKQGHNTQLRESRAREGGSLETKVRPDSSNLW